MFPSKILCFYEKWAPGKTTLIKALVKELEGIALLAALTFGIVNELSKE